MAAFPPPLPTVAARSLSLWCVLFPPPGAAAGCGGWSEVQAEELQVELEVVRVPRYGHMISTSWVNQGQSDLSLLPHPLNSAYPDVEHTSLA